MSTTLSPGIVCGRCSHGFGSARVQVRHGSVNEVRGCSGPRSVPAVSVVVDFVPEPVVVAPFVKVEAPRPAILAGSVWVLDGVLHQVRKARSSDRLFAFALGNVPSREVRPEWVYQGMASRVLASAELASAEVVARFGHVSGWCVFCSRQLDDPRSTSAGYGPVCAEKRGLAWG